MPLTLIWMLALGTPATLCAQSPPLVLTLDDAIARAHAHAPRLAEARAREAAADAAIGSREAAGRPSLVGSASFLRTNHVDEFGVRQPDGSFRILFPDIPSNYRTRAELTVPVYTAGRVASAVAAATAERGAAGADRRALAADVVLDVTRAYWGLVTARETVRVMSQALDRTDAWVADVKARVDAGILPPNDVLSAQAQRARQSVRLIEARNDAAVAEMHLARLIGAGAAQPITPATPVSARPASVEQIASMSADALLARALETRPEREALTARRDALALSAEVARAGTRPQVAAVAAIEPARPNARFVPRMDEWRTSWDLGVQMTWPILDGGRARADQAAARAQADAVSERLREFDDVIAVDVRQRVLDLETARAALAAAEEAIAAATEAHRVVDERFRAGVATSTDVLDAQVALLEAELERTRLTAALRLGEARLVRTVGGTP
jgi:outer membrane protein